MQGLGNRCYVPIACWASSERRQI